MSAALIKQLRELRMKWIDLPAEGKRVRIIRPTEAELLQQFVKAGRITAGIEQAQAFVVDWEGFTAADIVGPAVGASDPLPFDQPLWAEVVSDQLEWVRAVTHALVELITDHHAARAADAKN